MVATKSTPHVEKKKTAPPSTRTSVPKRTETDDEETEEATRQGRAAEDADDPVQTEDDTNDSVGNSAEGTVHEAGSGAGDPEWHRAANEFVAKSDREIEALRNEDGQLPPAVHNWLSAIGKKGRATPPKSVTHAE